MKPLVVAGIGTDVGKTVVSAALCELLAADYWKPVVSGVAAGAVDDEIVSRLLSSQGSVSRTIFPSTYRLSQPLSPHIAARLDGLRVDMDRLVPPVTSRALVIELAGGVLVPLDEKLTNIDLLSKWSFPVVVVSRHYLGSINHTLLTLEALNSRAIPVAGIIYVGNQLPDTEEVIGAISNVRLIGTIPELPTVDAATISQVALSGCLDKRALFEALGE